MKITDSIEKSATLPGSYYRDEDIYRLQKERVFARSWQFITDTDRLADSILPHTLLPECLGEPLLITRSGDNIRVLSNVCTHRGSILVEEPCPASQKITCRYHGRCFTLDGSFASAPGFEEAADFPGESDNLARASHGIFGKFIFASINPDISFDDMVADMRRRTSFLPLEDAVFDPGSSRDYYVNANWALYVDNYLEGLHVPYVHPSLARMLDTKDYRTELFDHGSLQIGVAAKDEDCFDLPPDSREAGKRIAAYYYFLFPNTMLNFYPWGISVNVVEPIDVSHTRIRFLTYVIDRSRMDGYSPADIDVTEKEDEAVVEAVQRGIQARLYKAGRYSPGWEKGVHQFHRMLSQRI